MSEKHNFFLKRENVIKAGLSLCQLHVITDSCSHLFEQAATCLDKQRYHVLQLERQFNNQSKKGFNFPKMVVTHC